MIAEEQVTDKVIGLESTSFPPVALTLNVTTQSLIIVLSIITYLHATEELGALGAVGHKEDAVMPLTRPVAW